MVEVKDKISAEVLPLMEDFYTIQGEGFYQGHAAYFIRLADVMLAVSGVM